MTPGTFHPLRDRLGASGRALVVGHRGAMGYRPENTLASFRLAADQGADLVEFDVHRTRDGHLVVLHDETLDRTTSGRGPVHARTLAEVRTLDAGAWYGPGSAGERVPTLDETLAWAAERGVGVDLEIKTASVPYPGIEADVVAALRRHGLAGRALVIAFDHHAAARVKDAGPEVVTGVLYVGRPVDPVALARAARADVLLPQWSYVTRQDVDAAHAAGLFVAPWVTSDPAAVRNLLACGVDAIGTNHPDVVGAVIRGQAPAPRA